MAFTRKMQKDAFNHVATNILVLSDEEIKAFQDARLDNILNFINMDDQLFASVQMTDSNNNKTPLPACTRMIIIVFMSYLHFLDETSATPVGHEWMNLNSDDFESFRQGSVIKHYKGKTLDNIATVKLSNTMASSYNATTTPTMNATATVTKKVIDPVQEFDKGVKRDITAFPSLKDERNWDQFLRTTKAVARTQKVSTVFDSTYVPTTNDEQELFE